MPTPTLLQGSLIAAFTLLPVVLSAATSNPGEILYNGIVLPPAWPPNDGPVTREPQSVPYLASPPAVIPIDTGRQLLVDDFLVEQTTLKRTFHPAKPYEGNPVLRPERPWEVAPTAQAAAPFSDGVWFDPKDNLFKMWYLVPPDPAVAKADAEANPIAGAPPLYRTCLAYSRDGIRWERPVFDVVPGTNIVLEAPRDSGVVWLNHAATDPNRRFALMRNHRQPKVAESDIRQHAFGVSWHWSPDGIHWTDAVAASGGLPWIGDRHTAFYNPFRRVWVFSLRNTTRNDPEFSDVRVRLYAEHADPEVGVRTMVRHPWVRSDRLDPRHPKFPDFEPQLYNLDAAPYESLMVGMFSVLMGPENEDAKKLGIHKRNEVLLGFSRDGYHWDRSDRGVFFGVNETDGAWNWGNVQSVGGGCVIVGDRLYFYFSGRRWSSSDKRGETSTGLAFLRRDGFASMDADAEGGTLTTRVVTFSGREMFVNADTSRGDLKLEVLDAAGNVIAPYTLANCQAVRADGTRLLVQWREAKDLSALAGQKVKFRFQLRSGSLYSFWLSPDRSGASRGFVAAGGPGYNGPVDLPSALAAGSKR